MTVAQDAAQPGKPSVREKREKCEAKTQPAPPQPVVSSATPSQPVLISFRPRNYQSRPKPSDAPSSQPRVLRTNRQNFPIHPRQIAPLLLRPPLLKLLQLPAPHLSLPCLRDHLRLAKSPSSRPSRQKQVGIPSNAPRSQSRAIRQNRSIHPRQITPLLLGRPLLKLLQLPSPQLSLPCLRDLILAKSPSRRPRCDSPMECKFTASLLTTNLRGSQSRAGHRTLQRIILNGTSNLTARFTLFLWQ